MVILLVAPGIHSQESVVLSGLQQLHSSIMPGGLHGAVSDLLRAIGTPLHVFEPAPEVSGACPLRRLQEKKNIYWGKDPPGPSAPPGAPGSSTRQRDPARPPLNAGCQLRPQRGPRLHPGPWLQTKGGAAGLHSRRAARSGRRRDRGQGLAAPLVRSPFCARTPMRDGLGCRDF
ncbi:hypothetical protein NDU88_003628 [Pleurodeles waltl]|uniref:Uncharacterized protein n=1 Tax=Pleurodeles waltl TaxID=8319 RepID=A0AAV7QDL7_PLEWA|nr:hypothetical protein NDU88_003628 [Pleurodeles waltl]